MRSAKLLLLSLLLLGNAFWSCGQNAAIIPKEFIEIPLPKAESDEWYELNYAEEEFSVSFRSNQLEVEASRETAECRLKIDGGTLVGINRGEWGGQLAFVPDDNRKQVVIQKGNVNALFMFNNKTYFTEGLAHLSYNAGALYELNRMNGRFSPSKLIDFDDAPEVCTVYRDQIFIATYERFYVVRNFKKELVFEDAFWGGLYPNSIAVLDEHNVFLGMRGGIAQLDLTKRSLRFFKYRG